MSHKLPYFGYYRNNNEAQTHNTGTLLTSNNYIYTMVDETPSQRNQLQQVPSQYEIPQERRERGNTGPPLPPPIYSVLEEQPTPSDYSVPTNTGYSTVVVDKPAQVLETDKLSYTYATVNKNPDYQKLQHM